MFQAVFREWQCIGAGDLIDPWVYLHPRAIGGMDLQSKDCITGGLSGITGKYPVDGFHKPCLNWDGVITFFLLCYHPTLVFTSELLNGIPVALHEDPLSHGKEATLVQLVGDAVLTSLLLKGATLPVEFLFQLEGDIVLVIPSSS